VLISGSPAEVRLTDWPEGTQPAGAAVFVHNQVTSRATPGQAWRRLVRAAAWPTWYPNSTRIQLPDGEGELGEQMVFSWTTFGSCITSRVTVFEPERRLEWAWWRRDGYGYHRWLIEPADYGCRVVTEETHRGPTPTRLALLLHPALRLSHEVWLRQLARLAPLDDVGGGQP
jgi:hypothetical protein